MAAALPQLDELFRHRYGAMVAGLCRVLGAERLDLVEDVVQEAMLRALRRWPAEGVPERPDAWLFAVARNLALDALRRQRLAARVEAELARWAAAAEIDSEAPCSDEFGDDTLRMMFACCHPSVPADARVALVLKTVAGFGVPEIAAALLQKEATIAQRLVRAKARLQREAVELVVPPTSELPERLATVLDVLYLMFNEGYRAHRGAELVRGDLVQEAVRLAGLLLEQPTTRGPAVHALLALLLLQGARLPARLDAMGEVLTLAEQDRSRWDPEWLRCGFWHLRAAMGGERLTAWHAEAGIASVHAAARDYADTDWRQVLAWYDRLIQVADAPLVRLNRAIAVAKLHGAGAALRELAAPGLAEALDGYQLWWAVRAQLAWTLGDLGAAALALERAIACGGALPEQRLLARRLAAVQRGEPAPAW